MPMCPCSCHPTRLLTPICQPLYHCQCLQAVQECCNCCNVTVFSPVSRHPFFPPLFFSEYSNNFDFVSLQTVNLSPTAEISNMDSSSSSAFFDTTSADSTPLNTKNPSFDVQLPEDSKQRVNKGFRVSEILGTTNSYRNSILEFFTNFAK